MKRILIKPALLSLLIGLLFSMDLAAQQPAYLEFHALLRDIDDEIIANDSCMLKILLGNQETDQFVFLATIMTGTDNDGWMTVNFDKQTVAPGMKVILEFTPTARTKWLEKGDKFSINYSFVEGNGLNKTAVVRSDGSELETNNINGTTIFTDSVPFAYIQAGFLLTKELKPDLALALRKKIDAGYELPSRGVKSGFAVGGYNKQQP